AGGDSPDTRRGQDSRKLPRPGELLLRHRQGRRPDRGANRRSCSHAGEGRPRENSDAAMSAGRRKMSRLPGARKGPAAPGPRDQARAYLRLRQLYEISKLLTSFENVEETIAAIVGLVGQTLPLRSVIFILETVGPPRTIVWKADGESEERLRAAKAHARGSYSYLVRSGVDLDAVAARMLPGPLRLRDDVRLEAEDATSFVLLPLVVDHRPIFGALQFETAPRLDELD